MHLRIFAEILGSIRQPGTGPNLNLQRNLGFWRIRVIGYPENDSQRNSTKLVAVSIQDNKGDPGYWSTSKMLLECALSLIYDSNAINNSDALEGA